MRLRATLVDRGVGDRVPVQVQADPGAPVAVLAAAVQNFLRGGSGGRPRLFVGDRPLPEGLPLGRAGLRDGHALAVGGPLPPLAGEPGGLVELRVIGGPGAGRVYRCPPGEYVLGSSPACRIRLAAGPPAVAGLRVGIDGQAVLDPVDGAAMLDDRPMSVAASADASSGIAWPLGGLLTAGSTLLELARPVPADAALAPAADGTGLDYSRPPRLVPPAEPARLRLPSPPAKPERRGLPLLPLLLVPIALACAGALVFGNARFLLFGLLSPAAAVVTQASAGRRGIRGYREKLAEHTAEVARLEREADAAVGAEERTRRLAAPDPAAAGLLAVGPRRRLWERRFDDVDFLDLRVGTADLPSAVEVDDPTRDEHRRREPRPARDVPVGVPMRHVGVVGVACGADTQPVATWLVLQASVLHSPTDLRICLLTGADGESRWGWLRWLPHAAPAGEDALLFAGTTAESVSRRAGELAALVGARHAAGARARRGGVVGQPDVLVVLDGARRLRAVPGVVSVLRDGPAVGVYAICLDAEERVLPEECRAVVTGDASGLRVQQAENVPVGPIRPDVPGLDWCREVASALAPLRPTADADDTAVLPSAVRLLDLLELDPPAPDRIAAGWATRPRSTSAPVGAGLDGPMRLDLVADGPHGLIAGTTGSGKSELLQTVVASFAVANRPDELTFVLVDYKGGSAFAECAALPHTVGMVTDLDAHLVRRALTSLRAELRRREHALATVGARDVDDYLQRRGADPALPPLPRLVLVIDEFAALVRELPDFVTGLVDIAQRGRSLGIHLVLATQRPSGAVTADIRANTNLRIALRTTDGTESRDIIDVPDAGEIPPRLPGRAYARLGHAAVLPFQSARVGGRRPGPAAGPAAPEIVELRWERLGDPPQPATVRQDGHGAQTDLGALVAACGEAAVRLGVARTASPWLPPLPPRLTLDEVGVSGKAVFGLVDLPHQQAREPFCFDLDAAGHLHVVGSARAGRSQTLRSLAYALATAYSCADLHLYGMDFGNGALQALTAFPHTGAVVDRTQVERLGRLLDRLTGALTARQALLGEHGVADLTELRRRVPAADRPAHVVVLVDRVEVFDRDFAHHDQGSFVDRMARLLRDGAGAGIHFILAGDRVLGAHRYVATTEDKILLRLNDRADYAGFGVAKATVPEQLPAGRGVRAADGSEVQIALAGGDPSGAAQAEALAALGAGLRDRDREVPTARRAARLEAIPDRLGFDEAWERRPPGTSPLWALVGVGGDDLTAVGPDLAVLPTFAVGGPPRSGRSTALLAMARSLLRAGSGLVVVSPRPSHLRSLAGNDGVVAVLTDPDVALSTFRDALRQVGQPTGVVVVDDAEQLVHSELEPDLTALSRGRAGAGWALVVAGDAEALSTGMSGWSAQVRRNRSGALLAPRSVLESELVGARIPHGLLGPQPPGRGHLHLGDGRFVTVQVPEAGTE